VNVSYKHSKSGNIEGLKASGLWSRRDLKPSRLSLAKTCLRDQDSNRWHRYYPGVSLAYYYL